MEQNRSCMQVRLWTDSYIIPTARGNILHAHYQRNDKRGVLTPLFLLSAWNINGSLLTTRWFERSSRALLSPFHRL